MSVSLKNGKWVMVEVLEKYSLYQLEGDVDKAIKKLQEDKEEHAKNFIELSLEVKSDPYENETCLCLVGDRPLTEEEEQARITEDEKRKARRKQQYENLKKEFEND